MSHHQAVDPGVVREPSGTSVAHVLDTPPELERLLKASSLVPIERSNQPKQEGEEQALESHEVIELQTFSERKAWIEEKIKFLERMPPIEVFVGLQAIKSSSEEVPGLPTRAELQQWIAEHDVIEKETEIFDTGELTKLRQLTKAATQRNLSPEDTDVIELTLTTIYELDKLLHLLRDRSENLELLGIRLTWEEHRIAAWVDRRKLIEDLQIFLETRARWNPSVYDSVPSPSEEQQPPSATSKRRGSMASIASSVASDSSVSSAAFSRSARFKLAEVLSRDAAQFAGRVTTLRHARVVAAGKVLDKLIDHSRGPVPEVLLDEQDRLEEKAIAEMEHIGKFVMNVIMQWRKADEIYVETMKDQLSAQNLLEEIETAMLHHPTARQSASFVSRADALLKRLSLRGNPASSTSAFPRPEHPLFGDQKASNESLARDLSAEIMSATCLARKVDLLAKDYRATCEAVKRAETLTQSAGDLSSVFLTILDQLRNGVSTLGGDGDGTPPRLISESCLDPTRHSVFLALLPSILESYTQTNENASTLIKSSGSIVVALDFPGVDPSFQPNAIAVVEQLHTLQGTVDRAVKDVVACVGRLRESRKIWTCLIDHQRDLETFRRRLWELMEVRRWRSPSTRGNGTPPSTQVLGDFSLGGAEQQVRQLESQFSHDVALPLAALSGTLEPPVMTWISGKASGFRILLDMTKQMITLLESLNRQSDAMQAIRFESSQLELRIEEGRGQVNTSMNDVLETRLANGDVRPREVDMQSNIKSIEADVATFIDSFSTKIPFISRQPNTYSVSNHFTERRLSIEHPEQNMQEGQQVDLPFSLSLQDDAVRSECNALAMKLGGGLESLAQVQTHFRLATMAKEVDKALAPTVADLKDVAEELDDMRQQLETIRNSEQPLESLIGLSEDLEEALLAHRTRIGRAFEPIRLILSRMAESPGVHHPSVHETLYISRLKAVEISESNFQTWDGDALRLKNEILDAIKLEKEKSEALCRAEERRLEAERQREAEEEAERARLQKLKEQAEEQQRLEDLRILEEQERRAEQERLAVLEAERLRAERERLEAEEKERLEAEMLAEALRLEAERARAAAEEAEKSRLQQERLEMEAKLRLVEEELAAERQSQLERERVLAQEAEALRLAAENQERLRLEAEQRSQQELREREERERLRELEMNNKVQANRLSAAFEEDVFGLRLAPAFSPSKSPSGLQARILALRKRLRALSLHEVLRPSKASSQLPTQEVSRRVEAELSAISAEVTQLPASVEDPSTDIELRSLRTELEGSLELMPRMSKLVQLSDALQLCDAALSDLLEHIDSFPSCPLGVLASPHRSAPKATPDNQLSARLRFTKQTIDDMSTRFAAVADDPRAVQERDRVVQTWSELEEMGSERLGGGKMSRPASVLSSRSRSSSGRSSSAAVARPTNKKANAYANLSVGGSTRGRHLAPVHPSTRRVVSGNVPTPNRTPNQSRPASQMSMLSTSSRAVSGPLAQTLYGSTFASRQRTASLTGSPANIPPPLGRRAPTSPRPRGQPSQAKRSNSPSMSEASSYSRSGVGTSRSSTSMSTWSRAPRNSLSSILPHRLTPKHTPPQKKPVPRKKYVADPKNKLDVAVGDVVNNLPVGINIEGVEETWKDQSGKYWIGNQDPKLCFCRILRSHTVMVRVGGGWQELSRFIQDHFAESFRLMPDSPPRQGGPEERWISSTTLLEASESDTVPAPPRTPEPMMPFVPSFALMTPSGHSPHSLKSSPSTKGSPLTPLQFIRRADPEMLRPGTPSKPPLARNRIPAPSTSSSRNSVWRP